MAKEIAAGTVICQDGEMADSIYLIMSGTVRATYAVGEFFLEKGDIIGLCEIYREKYHFSYTALDDVTIASFPYHLDSLTSLFDRKPEFARYAAKSCFKQLEKYMNSSNMTAASFINTSWIVIMIIATFAAVITSLPVSWKPWKP